MSRWKGPWGRIVGQRGALRWITFGALLFVAAAWSAYGEVWRKGPTTFVPSPPVLSTQEWNRITRMDYEVVVARVSRNAHALVHEPWNLFDGEQCHPFEKALALGDPMIASGLLGTPGYLVSGDPVLTYNVTLVSMATLSAVAMAALVWSWSGVPAAAISAGIVYAFSWHKLRDVAHPYIFDNLWTVLAMLFGWRLFRGGRIRDALALAACGVLQMGESFYSFLAAAALAPLYAGWLVFKRRGLPGWKATLAAGAILTLGGFAIFLPYLEAVGLDYVGGLQAFETWDRLSPWEIVGWPATCMLLLALVAPRRLRLREDVWDPRWVLLACGLTLALLAAGGNTGDRWQAFRSGTLGPPQLPNPYAWLAGALPGLRSVRGPMYLGAGLEVVFGVLVGLGVAALVRLVPRRRSGLVGIAVVCLLWVHTLRPAWLGVAGPPRMEAFRIRPAPEALDFYARLAELGNRGPLLELPAQRRGLSSSQILLAAYHRRRTSACYMSVVPASYDDVIALASELPSVESIAEASRLGFTTIVLRTSSVIPMSRARALRFDRALARGDTPLRLLHRTPEMVAYEIERVGPVRPLAGPRSPTTVTPSGEQLEDSG